MTETQSIENELLELDIETERKILKTHLRIITTQNYSICKIFLLIKITKNL